MRCHVTVMLAGLLLLLAAPVWAEEPGPQEEQDTVWELQVGNKVMRGVANFGLGWTEIPKQIYLIGRRDGWVVGALRGPIDGLGMFGARTIAGMYELLTFPLPVPSRYQPLVEPEFVWQADPHFQAKPAPKTTSVSLDASVPR
jgi:putative exosortase-associated protein (TIGR04073 family)